LQVLLGWLDCSLDDGSATLDLFSNVTSADGVVISSTEQVMCWEGFHQGYGVLALNLFIFYSLSSSLLGVAFLEDPHPSVDVRYREDYVMLQKLMQLVVLIASTLFTETLYVTELVSMGAFGVLSYQCLHTVEGSCDCDKAWCNSGLQVCNIDFIRTLLAISNTLCCWFSLVSLLAQLYYEDPTQTWVPFIALLAGSGIIILGIFFKSYVHLYMKSRNRAKIGTVHTVELTTSQSETSKSH